jgi:hypothetical protein
MSPATAGKCVTKCSNDKWSYPLTHSLMSDVLLLLHSASSHPGGRTLVAQPLSVGALTDGSFLSHSVSTVDARAREAPRLAGV